MPAKKISELDAIQSTQLVKNDLITLVDSSETDITNINKKITIGEFVSFLRDSSLFPISFNNTFINPVAFINGDQVPISNKVKGSINLSEYGKLMIDDYGRIYDAEELVETADIDIQYASGTCATLVKNRSDINNPGQPGPAQSEFSKGSNNALGGYFNENSYFNPGTGPNSQEIESQGNPSSVNYSDRQNNDLYWDYLFGNNTNLGFNYKSYDGVKRTTIQLNYMTTTGKIGTGFIDIDWNNARLNGNLLLPSNNGNNFPFIFENNSILSTTTTYLPKGQNFDQANGLVQPKILLNGVSKQILGLPIPTFINGDNTLILNSSIAINLIVKNFK